MITLMRILYQSNENDRLANNFDITANSVGLVTCTTLWLQFAVRDSAFPAPINHAKPPPPIIFFCLLSDPAWVNFCPESEPTTSTFNKNRVPLPQQVLRKSQQIETTLSLFSFPPATSSHSTGSSLLLRPEISMRPKRNYLQIYFRLGIDPNHENFLFTILPRVQNSSRTNIEVGVLNIHESEEFLRPYLLAS